MARFDEQKPVNDENVEPIRDEPRKGDVLGLSGSDVPNAPDPSAASDLETIAQRPESGRVGNILGLTESEELPQNPSATGTDKKIGRSGADDTEE
jgi:hypothetical protein